MAFFVYVQVSGFCEAFPAFVTDIGSFISVSSHMNFKNAFASKFGLTLSTRDILNLIMNALDMIFQVTFGGELLFALFTFMLHIFVVRAFVILKASLVMIGFCAFFIITFEFWKYVAL
jgi:hypothetical protein